MRKAASRQPRAASRPSTPLGAALSERSESKGRTKVSTVLRIARTQALLAGMPLEGEFHQSVEDG